MQANDLDDLFQSAYKNKHNTETALPRVKYDIELALDDDNAIFLVMLDLSAVFDTIDHDILLQRLEHMALVSKSQPFSWFQSYFNWSSFRDFGWWF